MVTSLNSPLLTCRVHGFMRLFPYLYTSICSIQLETRLIRSGNMFPVINSPMSVLMWGLILCFVQSSKLHKWAFVSKSPHQWWVEWFVGWHLLMGQHWNPHQFAEGLHFCHIERFSSVVVGPVIAWSFSGYSNVGDMMFYRIPVIHGALIKWSYGKIPNASLTRRCCAPSLIHQL